MFFAEYEGQLYTVDGFRQKAGADYYARGIFPKCPDCAAKVTIRSDGQVPHDNSDFTRAKREVAAHFSHFPMQGDPECKFLTSNNDPRFTVLGSGIERNPEEIIKARRQFVTDDHRITQAGYMAGFLMARMLGSRLAENYQFFDDAKKMLDIGLIPEPSHKLWKRKAPVWARPFAWMLFHDFPMIGRNGKPYTVKFKLDDLDQSQMDMSGRWHGPPAALIKVFKDSGEPLMSEGGKIARYEVTEENAWFLARQAMNWGENRPFPHVRLTQLKPYALFANVAKPA